MNPFQYPSATPTKRNGRRMYIPTIVDTRQRPYRKTYVGTPQTDAGAAKRIAAGVSSPEREITPQNA